jgi:hypothetical protein
MISFKVNRAANNNKRNTGSALQARENRDSAAEVDTLMTLNDAVLRAYGYTLGTSETAQARRYTIADREAAAAALLDRVASMGIGRSGDTPRVS